MERIVPLPLNITRDELPFFSPHRNYTINTSKIKYLKNVFITNSGFCVNQKGLIKESHHNFPQQYNDYLLEASYYYNEVQEYPDKLISLEDDNVYLSIHHPWFNYYHWMAESIFRLWLVRRKLDKLILILPDFYKDADFIMGSLKPFNIPNIYFIKQGHSLFVRNLCLPQLKPVCDSYNKLHVRQVREFYLKFITENKIASPIRCDKIYISRQLATRRRVINFDEIEAVLNSFGFIFFCPEKHPFLEQVAVLSQAKYVVGEHGSGLTNILFMRTNGRVLELHKNKTNELNYPSPLFWYLTDVLGIAYYHQFCQDQGKVDYFEGNYIVDKNLLERNLQLLLSE